MHKRGFGPIINKDCTVLILGSFPSEASLKKGQYYGHPLNQFWRIIGDIVNENMREMSYPDKKRALLSNNIALWDVISSCEREGSLDSDIKNEEGNELEKIHRLAPKIRLIVFNGKKAGSYEHIFKGFDTKILPSTSPAYTMKYEKKLKEWETTLAKWTKTK